jgi:hypothetical protein
MVRAWRDHKMQWYYAVNGKANGPHSEEDLEVAVASGQIDGDTLVWREGMEEWTSASDVPELNETLNPATPPPVPPMKKKAASPPPIAKIGPPTPSVDVESDYPEFVRPMLENAANRRLAGPWSRYFARMLDMSILATVIFLGLGLYAFYLQPGLSVQMASMDDRILFLLVLPFAHVLNAVIISMTGNSPAKALFAIKAVPLAVDRTAFTFTENIRRELRVWIRGLGFGFPLITLFTMISAYNKVSKGLPAGYDEGAATVLSQSDSQTRRAGAMLLTAAVLIGITALNVMDRNELQRIARPYTWTNPGTGVTTTIPANWQYEQVEGPDNNTLYGFTNLQTAVVALLGVERFEGAHLGAYADAFRRGVADSMSLGEWQPSSIDGAWKSVGSMTSNPDNAVTVHVIQRGEAFWRVVYVDQTGKISGEIMAPEMTRALLSSTGR